MPRFEKTRLLLHEMHQNGTKTIILQCLDDYPRADYMYREQFAAIKEQNFMAVQDMLGVSAAPYAERNTLPRNTYSMALPTDGLKDVGIAAVCGVIGSLAAGVQPLHSLIIAAAAAAAMLVVKIVQAGQ